MYADISNQFPYLIEDADKYSQIKGELYLVRTQEDIDFIDLLEGVPKHYYRKKIKVISKRGKLVSAWAYFRSEDNPYSMKTTPMSEWVKTIIHTIVTPTAPTMKVIGSQITIIVDIEKIIKEKKYALAKEHGLVIEGKEVSINVSRMKTGEKIKINSFNKIKAITYDY